MEGEQDRNTQPTFECTYKLYTEYILFFIQGKQKGTTGIKGRDRTSLTSPVGLWTPGLEFCVCNQQRRPLVVIIKTALLSYLHVGATF